MAIIRDGTVRHNKRTFQLRGAKAEWEGLSVGVRDGFQASLGRDNVSIFSKGEWLTYADASTRNPPSFDDAGTGEKGWWLASLVTELKGLSTASQIEVLNSFRRNAGESHEQARDVAGVLTAAYNIPWVYNYDDHPYIARGEDDFTIEEEDDDDDER